MIIKIKIIEIFQLKRNRIFFPLDSNIIIIIINMKAFDANFLNNKVLEQLYFILMVGIVEK